MTVRPYAGDGSKREQVERMFDAISPKYDLLNRICSFGIDQRWRRKVILTLAKNGARNVLDVATGTADLALMAARKGMTVTGVDISKGMLRLGHEKVVRAGLGERITLIQADSERLPFPDGSFDGVMVAFGVRNFEHLERGLAEMHRVLKPGGHLCVLEFSRPRGIIGPVFRSYFHHVMPAIGRMVSKDAAAYTYLPKSVDAFPDGPDFLRMLTACGLAQVAAERLNGGIATLYTARR